MLEQVKDFFSVVPPEGLRTAIERDFGIVRRYYLFRHEWEVEKRKLTIFLPQMGIEIYMTWPPKFDFAASWMDLSETCSDHETFECECDEDCECWERHEQ